MLTAAAEDMKVPPIPKPSGVNSFPPGVSETITVARGAFGPIKVSAGNAYLRSDATSVQNNDGSTISVSFNPAVPNCQVVLQRYWQNLASYQIVGPQTFTRSVSLTEGSSQTDAQTLCAEIGVSFEGFSASLSQTLSTSITIMSSTTTTETYSITVPDGKTFIYTIWQLVDVVLLVDATGAPFSATGQLFLTFPMPHFIPFGIPYSVPLNSLIQPGVRRAADPVSFPSSTA